MPLPPKTVSRLYQKLSKYFPDARSELHYKNKFQLLVSVILSAQSTDKTVNSVTPELFALCPSPEAFLQCGEARLRRIIKPIGLAPAKAKNIINTCKILLDRHRGKIPDNREALESLPGVGRKTASVVLNEAFGQATIAVDTHVFRVANRTGLAPGKTVRETEAGLLEVTPEKWRKQAHRYLILHGRYVCKAKNYHCAECVIVKECEYPDKIL
ncbi:MAG: endonuclease III [Nitrospinales bacterium]